MSFELRPAVRAGIPLVIGIAGPTGSGKTYSALRLAKGLAGDKPFALIDTENGRALHYADEFAFHHGGLAAPFTPDHYAEAIKATDEQGYPVIVVDSVSHEHNGEGGLLDMHEEKLTKLAGTDYRKRAAMTMLAWVEPKTLHKRLVSRLLQINAHLIICFRAEQKVEMVKNDRGETEIRPKRSFVGSDDGWIPVAEKNLAYELTLLLLVTPEAPGMPKPIKLEQQHRLIVPLNQPLSEDVGVALGAWADGKKSEAEGRALALTTELLTMADELGADKRETFTAAVLKNRRANGIGAKHEKWLGDQLERARAALEEKAVESDADLEVEAQEAAAA